LDVTEASLIILRDGVSRAREEAGNKEWPDLKVRTWGIFGLNGSDNVSMEFEITNKSKEAVTLETATLAVKKGSYPLVLAQLSDDPAWRTVPPGGVRRMPLAWPVEITGPLPEWLGPSPKVTLDLKQGMQPRIVGISYVFSLSMRYRSKEAGQIKGTTAFVDATNQIKVIVDTQSGRAVTVLYYKPPKK
jgi:hypothetical protein